MELFAPWHIAVLVIVALLVFGPRKLPEIGSSLGRSITTFRKAMAGVEDEADPATNPVAATTVAEARPAVAEISAAALIGPDAAPVESDAAVPSSEPTAE